MTCSVTPQTAPSSAVSRSTTRACSTTSMPGSSTTRCSAAMSAREISAPVASPPACAIRSRWWPPSRVSLISPSASRSNSAPSATSSRTRSGPSVTRMRTASGSHSPTPATRVSSRCSCGVSSGSSAAAMPPWAHCVDPADSTVLVTSSTRSTRSRSRSAQVSPAMPEPTTTTSALVVHPGAGALSRRGRATAGTVVAGIPAPQTSARACDTSENTSSGPPPGPTTRGLLSMSRVVPTRAATARSASPRYHSGTSARVCGCTSTR